MDQTATPERRDLRIRTKAGEAVASDELSDQPGHGEHTRGGAGPTRRSVLRTVGLGSATVLVLGTAGLSYRAFDNGVLDADGGDAFDPWRHWRSPGSLGCVAAAVLAANPHNSQAWAFAVSDGAIDVLADRTRSTGTLDPLGRELELGLGCALENLVIATRAQGLDPTVTLLPDGATGDRVASVALGRSTSAGSDLYEAIGRRHTNRGPYRNQPVPTSTLNGLVETTDLPGVQVTWVTDTTGRTQLGQLLVDAAVAITQDNDQSRDSFVWFRSSTDDIQRHRDGLTLNGQGLSPTMLTLAKLMPASSRTAGDEFWVKQTRTVHTATAAAYGVITAADPDDTTTRLNAGRLLQRIHLSATARGIGLQHMNQITERIDRERATGAPAGFAPRFAALLPGGRAPIATFRVGYPVRTPHLSPRRPLSQVTR